MFGVWCLVLEEAALQVTVCDNNYLLGKECCQLVAELAGWSAELFGGAMVVEWWPIVFGETNLTSQIVDQHTTQLELAPISSQA